MPRRPDRPFGADPEELDSYEQPADPHEWMLEGYRHGLDRPEPTDPQPVDNAVEENRGRHRRGVPKSSKLERLRKAFRSAPTAPRSTRRWSRLSAGATA